MGLDVLKSASKSKNKRDFDFCWPFTRNTILP